MPENELAVNGQHFKVDENFHGQTGYSHYKRANYKNNSPYNFIIFFGDIIIGV